MSNHYQILVIGGGNAGLSVASKLLIEDKNLNIGIVEPSEKHYYAPAWTLVGAGIFDINATEKNEKDYMPKNATWIKDAVATFQPNDNKVVCLSGKEISYDYLVVCPGIQIDWNKITGLPETLGKNNVTSNYSFKTLLILGKWLKILKVVLLFLQTHLRQLNVVEHLIK